MPGTVAGTNDEDAEDADPVPAAFVAATVHVYVLPFVSPDTEIGLEPPDPDPDDPPSDDTHDTAYDVIVAPPSLPGAENATDT